MFKIGSIHKDEQMAIKGIAILFIVLHNLLHLMNGVHENEFNYIQTNATTALYSVFTLQQTWFKDFFSYYGWYGVPIFVFLSGYGLERKYSKNNISVAKTSFVYQHFLKLFKLMAPTFSIYLIGYSIYIEPIQIINIISQYTMLSNIIAPHSIQPGVYWYFGLALQLYILYVLFFHNKRNIYIIIFSLASIIFMVTIITINNYHALEYIRHNCIGWLLPFCFGIWVARKKEKKKKRKKEIIHLFIL